MDSSDKTDVNKPAEHGHSRNTRAPQSRLRNSHAWRQLDAHFDAIKDLRMTDLFAEDDKRFERFSIEFEGLMLDYSKNRITEKTMQLLLALAKQENIEKWRDDMFSGEKINNTEQRAVLHTALRNRSNAPVYVDGANVMVEINHELKRMRSFVEDVRHKSWLGYSGLPIMDIVNIGIGGSDLGPQMVTHALINDHSKVNVHFISNVDAEQINATLENLRPESTLFVIASKTFSTQETMTNAETAKRWFLEGDGRVQKIDIRKHFVAVTNNVPAAEAFGIDANNTYRLWDWVGGRYSLWSSIGLSVALGLGMDKFEALLEGAYAMDEHFKHTPLEDNLPVVLALLGIWYGNFFNAESAAILPYNYCLRKFPAFLEQMDMESNGKSVDREGHAIGYDTGKIIWGAEGINGQHAFYQLLHQGTRIIPTDFIFAVKSLHDKQRHTDIVAANFLAQTEALMIGRDKAQTRDMLEKMNLPNDELEARLPHMIFLGNQPSNSILMKELDARTLGSLIAMYEHKVFVQGMIWNLNSYDQWGVELGKILTGNILSELESGQQIHDHDQSTRSLIEWVSQHRR